MTDAVESAVNSEAALVWEQLTTAQRLFLVGATHSNVVPYGGSQRKCAYNLIDAGLVEDASGGRGAYYGLTDLGRRVAAHGERQRKAGVP